MDRTHGIHTILMTDVVGSTRLWAAHPHAMPGAIERLEKLADAAVEAEGGRVLKRRGEGDSLFCLLPHPAGAARAALSLVRALAAEPWPDGLALTVRAAVHCGPAHVRGEDLFGPVPNRCGRLREVAHGGQVLLTGAARGQIGPADGIALRELGRHRLRDLDEPESVAQVVADDLPSDFPPLRSLTSLRNNLPVQTTSFVGRENLRRDLLGRLASDRLTTLTGAGGCGKTRLSLQLGADTIDGFPDGVWFVELAEVAEEPAIVRAIAEACGFRDLPDGDVRALADRLRGRALFLLDNAEHALAPIGRVVAALMAAAPDLRFVVTSREPLRLRGERVHRVPPLSVPPPGCADPDEVVATEAGGLFLDRARLHLPEFVVRASNASAVGEIARRLDGIPLCLEMAASHVGYLGADQIAARLNDRFALLEGDDADAPPRHRTMRETIAWQYDGLASEEKILLQRLAAFAGSFTLDAAETVGGGQSLDPDQVLRHLRSLVDKSLVVAIPQEEAMRYRLLETIAQFATDQPERETEKAVNSLLDWALSLSAGGYTGLYGKEHQSWVATLAGSESSIRRAAEWGFAAQDSRSIRIVLNMTRYWHYHGRFTEAQGFLELAARRADSSKDLIDSHNALAVFCMCAGDGVAATTVLERLTERNDLPPDSEATVAINLATAYSEAERTEEALSLYTKAIRLAAQLGDDRLARSARYNLGITLIDLGRADEAITELSAVGVQYAAVEDITRLSLCCVSLSGIYTAKGDAENASLWLSKALSKSFANPSVTFAAEALLTAAWIAKTKGRLEDAALLLGGHQRACRDAPKSVGRRCRPVVEEILRYLDGRSEQRQAEGVTRSFEVLLEHCRQLTHS